MELEGFAEPYRTVEVAGDEAGVLAEMFVREGQFVKVGEPLVRLNSDVHQALLAIAEQSMNATGRVQAAKADLQMRQVRLEKLRKLRLEGHARQEEVDRAVNEFSVAQANLRTAEEEQLTRKLEYDKIAVQIARRTIRAPISGAITRIHKRIGEYLAPNSPEVLTLVQTDTLLANFTLTSGQAARLRLDQSVQVYFRDRGGATTGLIDFISPVTDAESGTVLVKVRIENSQGRFRSGERCTIQIGN